MVTHISVTTRIRIFIVLGVFILVTFIAGYVSMQYDSEVAQGNLYTDASGSFSINLPAGYVVDESYQYQKDPQTVFEGVKFTIPKDRADGTNLAHDTYVSVEMAPAVDTCTAGVFLDGVHSVSVQQIRGMTVTVATSSGAGAGNRYDETVYAFPRSHLCIAVRYFVHYGAIQNYEPGAVSEFNEQVLLNEFDRIRDSLRLHE